MTPERRKYIASISNEERAIRGQIKISKGRIKLLKQFIVEDNQDCMFTLEEKQTIATEKHIIKALKKQLPVRNNSIWCCDACGNDIDIFGNYCYFCGQKLR